jgi:hypothetical protein
MIGRKKRWLIIAMFLFSFVQRVQAQNPSYEELQAAYLYNFAKYIDWPEEITEFVIGVYGAHPTFIEALEKTVKEKKVKGGKIHLKNILSPEDATTCHIVYFPEKETRNLGAVSKEVKGSNVLLVSEKDEIKKGAAISFVVEEDRLRFKLKKASLKEAGLVATDGLLRLAIVL